MAVLCVISLVKGYIDGRAYVKDDTGNIVALKRSDVNSEELYSLNVTVKNKDETIKENVDLIFDVPKEELTGSEEELTNPRKLLSDSLMEIKDQILTNSSTVVMLPTRLVDGTVFQWKKHRNYYWLLFIIATPLFIVLAFENNKSKKRKAKEQLETSVKNNLPAFTSKLILLLQTGLVLSDAFGEATKDYVENGNTFSSLMAQMHRQYKEDNLSLVILFQEYSGKVGLREFTRLSKAIIDNQIKGADINKWLTSEGEILWEMRKNNAIDKGKSMETKLTFPLAALLIVIIIITAAPAVLQM